MHPVNLRDDAVQSRTFKMNFEEIMNDRLGLISHFYLNLFCSLCKFAHTHTCAPAYGGQRKRDSQVGGREAWTRASPAHPCFGRSPRKTEGEYHCARNAGIKALGVFSSLFWTIFNNFYSHGFCAFFPWEKVMESSEASAFEHFAQCAVFTIGGWFKEIF